MKSQLQRFSSQSRIQKPIQILSFNFFFLFCFPLSLLLLLWSFCANSNFNRWSHQWQNKSWIVWCNSQFNLLAKSKNAYASVTFDMSNKLLVIQIKITYAQLTNSQILKYAITWGVIFVLLAIFFFLLWLFFFFISFRFHLQISKQPFEWNTLYKKKKKLGNFLHLFKHRRHFIKKLFMIQNEKKRKISSRLNQLTIQCTYMLELGDIIFFFNSFSLQTICAIKK